MGVKSARKEKKVPDALDTSSEAISEDACLVIFSGSCSSPSGCNGRERERERESWQVLVLSYCYCQSPAGGSKSEATSVEFPPSSPDRSPLASRFQDAEPAEEPSPCAADEAAGLLEVRRRFILSGLLVGRQ